MIQIHNTLTSKKEEFVPVKKDGTVSMYSCGITVQAKPHIGHMRAAVTADIVKRVLVDNDYKVISLYNFTDIDDKIIDKAKEQGRDYREIAQENIDKFMEISAKMNLLQHSFYPRATNHIEDIVQLIETLVEKGFAYEKEGEIFFSVDKDKDYGKLSGKDLKALIKGKRIEIDKKKENAADFTLWKPAKEGEPFFRSPFGNGRPGWHIECSAMSIRHLGETFDIHTGGEDLIFPHHENEIAQSECATGKPFANYWVHNGMVNLKGEKMSKSIGNVFSMEELLASYQADVIRLYIFKTHYRKNIEFSTERLDEAKSAYRRIINVMNGEIAEDYDKAYIERIREELRDDFNTPNALSIIFEMVSMINDGKGDASVLRSTIMKAGGLMGFAGLGAESAEDNDSEGLMQLIIEIRNTARAEKQFNIADLIRDKLKEMNIVLQDSKEGTVWKKEE